MIPLFFSLNARTLLAHRACSSLTGIGLVGLGLSNTLGKDLGVLVLHIVLDAYDSCVVRE